MKCNDVLTNLPTSTLRIMKSNEESKKQLKFGKWLFGPRAKPFMSVHVLLTVCAVVTLCFVYSVNINVFQIEI